MRFGLVILLAATVPAGASLADQAKMTLRGAKSEKDEPADDAPVLKQSDTSRPVKTNSAMRDDGKRRRKPGKNDTEGNVDERFVAVPQTMVRGSVDQKDDKPKRIKKDEHVDKATYRAQKIAEREAELAERESKREAEKALREAKKAEKEAKKAELEAEKAQQEAEKQAEKEAKHQEKGKLKKRLDAAADNSTSIDEIEDDSSAMSLLSGKVGWMPTPSPIEDLTPWPTEPPMAMTTICPDEFDPERTEPYKAGDLVTVESSIFECQSGDFEEFCSIAELDKEIKKENKDAKRLWTEAWKFVSHCTVAEITDVDGVVDSSSEDAFDEAVEVNEIEEAAIEVTSSIETAADEDVPVEAGMEVATAVDIDSLLEPRSAELEQHNWDMGFEMEEDPCVSSVCNHQISETCLFKYQLNASQEANEPNTITIELICEGVTWLGVGFSQNGGLMAGSEAVIGVLGEEPRKYNLDGRWMGGVKPMDDSKQTLIDASINVYRGPITVLKFTKILEEQGEISIGPGDNTFLYAQGQSYFLGQHAHDSRGSFQLNLPSLGAPEMDVGISVDDTTTISDQPCTTEWCTEEVGGECALKYLVNYPGDEPSSITMDLTCEGEAWIGLGFSLNGSMDGSEAVIAGPGQDPRKYYLGGKWFGSGGVAEMPEPQQTLVDASVRVKWVEGATGWFPLTKMRFTKLLSEANELEIRPGENTFLYAQGGSAFFPSYHATRGSFTLTLPSDGSDSESSSAPASPEMEVTELSSDCTLKHMINVPTYTTRDVCEDCSITMELTCASVAWVAVGFSQFGFMPRSEAVIGIPNRTPEKYFLKKRNLSKIFRLPDEAQTLTDASVTVDGDETVLRFTKLLSEPNETPITDSSYFLFAHGYDENFGYHGPESRGSFQLSL